MAGKRRTMKRDPGVPRAGRPVMTKAYGIVGPRSGDGLYPWSHVATRMEQARNYWVVSSRPDGRPHAAPVWGIWLKGLFFFSTDPASRKGRNLRNNPAAVVHLESGDDVVIVEGEVFEVKDDALLAEIDEAYFNKYQIRLIGFELPSIILGVRPKVVLAWEERNLSRGATRWVFPT